MQGRLRVLDLCCCSGGAGMGYHRAGFDVARRHAPITPGDRTAERRDPLAGEDEYVTLTVVVTRDGTEEDPCDVLLGSRADVLFVGHQDGITSTALALGADPTGWS